MGDPVVFACRFGAQLKSGQVQLLDTVHAALYFAINSRTVVGTSKTFLHVLSPIQGGAPLNLCLIIRLKFWEAIIYSGVVEIQK